MGYFLERFPGEETLRRRAGGSEGGYEGGSERVFDGGSERAFDGGSEEVPEGGFYPKVNNHIHTPYSFSAFGSVEEAVRMASAEGIRVLGINDFNVTDGYEEFLNHCLAERIFPLLNMEMIGISREHQEKGIRINDPKNPGRIYISGKGMAFPPGWSDENRQKLERVIREGNRQVSEMVRLVNRWCSSRDLDLSLSVEEIMDSLAEKLLRERHVAKAIRLKIESIAASPREFKELLSRLYGGKETEADMADAAALEDEIRARLLKAGAPAFVREEESAFPGLKEIMEIIVDGGGVPTYPILLDGAGGEITEFENGKEQLADSLKELGFNSVELIPLRNEYGILKEYSQYLYNSGFSVSFGTEHNTSAMRPLTVSALNQIPLDDDLMRISFLGVAVQAAHQYLVAREGKGYSSRSREEMEKLGGAVLRHYFDSFAENN